MTIGSVVGASWLNQRVVGQRHIGPGLGKIDDYSVNLLRPGDMLVLLRAGRGAIRQRVTLRRQSRAGEEQTALVGKIGMERVPLHPGTFRHLADRGESRSNGRPAL